MPLFPLSCFISVFLFSSSSFTSCATSACCLISSTFCMFSSSSLACHSISFSFFLFILLPLLIYILLRLLLIKFSSLVVLFSSNSSIPISPALQTKYDIGLVVVATSPCVIVFSSILVVALPPSPSPSSLFLSLPLQSPSDTLSTLPHTLETVHSSSTSVVCRIPCLTASDLFHLSIRTGRNSILLLSFFALLRGSEFPPSLSSVFELPRDLDDHLEDFEFFLHFVHSAT
ncbi:hypothetical protein BLNAU_23780 [Blattamonas nauphoetae]|uniref:Uncharacterized protein n=1 Tax=Blattamonas nauphoetae TaxID=2049346 RepID=A0ABQ9WQ91_9EUKA|nr:hypothetical protein BLNAU_23780 [Blattamonas nauphoetae]